MTASHDPLRPAPPPDEPTDGIAETIGAIRTDTDTAAAVSDPGSAASGRAVSDPGSAASGRSGSWTGADPQGRLPDFFIVGHQKCGTTALYLMLRSHPEIFMPELKEPRFFATDQRSRLSRRGSAPSGGRPRTLDAYLSLFAAAGAGQRIGEASGQYLRSITAASGIAALRPDARIIAILREPASFLRSFHLQMVSSRVETETDLRTALACEDDRRAGRRIPRGCHHREALMYSDHVRYVEQLRRFHAVFPAKQVLVIIYDDFLSDNEATVRAVQRFLEVDDTPPVEVIQTKPVRAVRSIALHQLVGMRRRARRNPGAASRLERTVNALTPMIPEDKMLRRRLRRMVYKRPLPADQELIRELRARFKPEVQALSDYLGRDLVTLWGYADVD